MPRHTVIVVRPIGAKGDYDKAIADCTEAIRLDPKYALAYQTVACLREARATTTKRLPTAPRPFASIRNAPLAYLNRGVPTRTKGDYDKAIADFTEAIRLDPKYAQAYYHRGVVYGKKGDYDKAIADFTEAIRLDPKSAEAYRNRGVAYGKKGDYDKAIADCTEAIRLDPKCAMAYCGGASPTGRRATTTRT